VSGEPLPDFAPGLDLLFARLPTEAAYAVEPVEGALPSGLSGRYYLNGPSRFARGGLAYHHWLDGDGMVSRLCFDGSAGAAFACRWVESTKRRDEEAAGQALYRAFGTAFPGDRLRRNVGLENPVNVSVYPWSGLLLAFGEQGIPWRLDPETLETLGEHTFGGRLNAISPLSAHPSIDPETGELFNFGVSFAAARPALHVYRFAPGGEMVYRRRLDLPYSASMHDFGMSARFTVFYLAPYVMEVEGLLAGGRPVMDCLHWRPELGSRLIVANREDGAPAAEIPLGAGYCLHLVNAFETHRLPAEGDDAAAGVSGAGDNGGGAPGDGPLLVVDLVELDRPVYDQYQPIPDLFRTVSPGRPVRLVVDTRTWELIDRRRLDYDRAPDFPTPDQRLRTRPYGEFWMLGMSAAGRDGRKFFDQLVHCGWGRPEPLGVYQARPGCLLGGEPVFLPDAAAAPGEPAGWVLCQEYDAGREASAFLLFDAHRVDRGPVARLPLREPIPLGFHARFDAG
jgi:all-trans-8'-apo-beta-carotenal 15,15'-oxygenase